MILTEESRPSKRHWLDSGPLVFTLRYHHVYRNLIQTQNANSLLLPHPTLGRWPLPEDAREHFRNRFYLMNFHFGKDLGAKVARCAGPPKIFKKETTNLIFVIMYVASLWLSPPFFLLLKPTSATEKTKALCTVFSLLQSAFHRGNHFEPIKPITRFSCSCHSNFSSFFFFFTLPKNSGVGQNARGPWVSRPEIPMSPSDANRHGSSGSLSQTKVLKKSSLASRFKEDFLKHRNQFCYRAWGWLSFYPVRIRRSKM